MWNPTKPAFHHLPEHLQQHLQAELRPGETVAWAGQPGAARLMKTGFLLWLFFIPWTLFTLHMMTSHWQGAMPGDMGALAFSLFGLPFLGVGVWGLLMPWRFKRGAAHTVHAITSQRALTIEGIRSIKVRSFDCTAQSALQRVEHDDGSGDLILLTERYLDDDTEKSKDIGFMGIAEVRKVALLVEALQAKHRKAPGAT